MDKHLETLKKYNGHNVKLLKTAYPENFYQCENCRCGWIAKRKTALINTHHLGFISDGWCKESIVAPQDKVVKERVDKQVSI